MPDSLGTLDRLISDYLAGSIPFQTLEARFSPCYLFLPEDAFPDVETEVWYGLVHERIEWTAPAPSPEDKAFGWMAIDEFRAWLQTAVRTRTGPTPISWERYERDHARVQAAVFSGRDADDGPFVDDGWPRVPLVGGLRLDDEVFSALAGAAAARGDTRFVVAYRASVFLEDPPLEVPWTPAALEEVYNGTPFGHVEVDVFGASGSWGLLASPEEFAVLGGTAEFMADFLSRVPGGEDRLRREFAEAAARGDIGFGEPGRRFAARLTGGEADE